MAIRRLPPERGCRFCQRECQDHHRGRRCRKSRRQKRDENVRRHRIRTPAKARRPPVVKTTSCVRRGVEAYLVPILTPPLPRRGERRAVGLVIWHWLPTRKLPDGSRTQYPSTEAAGAGSLGAHAAAPPQGRFPGPSPPAASAEVLAEAGLRAGLDLLAARPNVDAARLSSGSRLRRDDRGGRKPPTKTYPTLAIIAAAPALRRFYPSGTSRKGDSDTTCARSSRSIPIEVQSARATPATVLFQFGNYDLLHRRP